MTVYGNRVTFNPRDDDRFLDTTDRSLFLERALHYAPVGTATTFPTKILKERISTMGLPENQRQSYHVVVISDGEVYYLLLDGSVAK